MSALPSMYPLWLAGMTRADWFRRDPDGPRARGRYTEWMHFCVLAEQLQILVNLSLHSRPGQPLEPRLLVAVHQDGWAADIEEFKPRQVDIRAGRFDAAVGDTRLSLRADGYHLRVRSERLGARIDLHLVPEAPVLLAPNASLPGGSTLSWLAAPRLRATGTVEYRGKILRLSGTPAYHDHNWGAFDWGADFAWDWGFALPESQPGSGLLFLRMMDRARHRVLCQGAWVWRDGRLVRAFRGDSVRFTSLGTVRAPHLCVAPRQLSSAVRGEATGVPRTFELEAAFGADDLRVTLTPEAPLRLIAPSEQDVTVVHESIGRVEVDGCIAGEAVRWSTSAVLEVVNG